MEFIEPRVVKVEKVSSSLLFHISTANNIMYDLRYVIRYLRSKAELQKIQEEKKLLREYERKQEQMRITLLQAQSQYNEKQETALTITMLYRSFKAKKIVKEKRIQLSLEKIYKQNHLISNSIVKFQVLFRRYSIRLFFYKRGIVFRGFPKYYRLVPNRYNSNELIQQFIKGKKTNNKGKHFEKMDLMIEVKKANNRRHAYHRNHIMGSIEEKYCQILQVREVAHYCLCSLFLTRFCLLLSFPFHPSLYLFYCVLCSILSCLFVPVPCLILY
jgi:hypothetical protein